MLSCFTTKYVLSVVTNRYVLITSSSSFDRFEIDRTCPVPGQAEAEAELCG